MTSLHELQALGASRSSEVPSRADRLRTIRRLDWRFLLPDTRLGRVGFLGRDDGTLVGALRSHAASVEILEYGPRAATGLVSAGLDLVVAHAADLDALPHAFDLLRPGGFIYCEISRAGVPLTTPEGTAQRFRRAGFEAVRLHWHRPSFHDAVEIVPLARPDLVDAVLRRDSARVTTRALARAARLLASARLLDKTLPCWSVVGRKPGGTPQPVNAVAAFLAAQNLAWQGHAEPADPATFSYRFRLPRFAASSHVIGFVHRPAQREPAIVIKTSRLPGDDAALVREASGLQALSAIRPGGFDSVPRLIATGEWNGSGWLAQTALAGRSMSADFVRRHEPECVAGVIAWLLDLHRATYDAPLASAGVERLVLEPLERARASAWGEAIEALAIETARHVGPELATLPAVFEHGDLGAPNLLVATRNGASGSKGPHHSVGVVDWECADRHGLPGADLVYFLTFVAGARRRARSVGEHVAAYHDAFVARDAWGASQLAAYAEALHLPRTALAELLLATWARAALRSLVRTEGESRPDTPEMGASEMAPIQAGKPARIPLAAARPVALWRYTLEHYSDLEFYLR